MKAKLILFYILISILIITGCGNKKEDENVKKDETQIVSVKKGNINQVVSASGLVTPEKEQVIITPKIIGTVENVYFEENCIVKKNQVIIELDKSEILWQLKQAEANLATAQIRVKQADTTVALQPQETQAKVSQAEAAWKGAQKQVEQLKTQLKAQEEQLKAKINEAEIAVKAAKENLEQLNNQTPILEKESQNAISQAKSSLTTAEGAYERQKSLYKEGFISKQDYEMAKNKYEIAVSEYNSAEQKMESAKIQQMQALSAANNQLLQAREGLKAAEMALEQQRIAKEKQIDVAQAQADQAKAVLDGAETSGSQITLREHEAEIARENVKQLELALAQIKDQLKKTEIRSPINGTVIKKQVTSGQTVSPTIPVAVIANLDTLFIDAMVDEGDIGKVKEHQKVKITTDNFPQEIFEGEIVLVASSASEIQAMQNVSNYKVKIKIFKHKALLKMGMNTYNDIIVAEKKDVLIIPNLAVHQLDGKNVVFLNDTNEPHNIEIGLSDNENTEVISGLSEGDKVIIKNLK